MIKFCYIGAGGLVGTFLRYWVSGLAHRIFESDFPWGTLSVNLIGSLIIGFLWGVFEFVVVSPNIRLMFLVGFLGAFTTFSTFSLENFNLIRDGEYTLVFMNMSLSFFLGIALVFAGYFSSRYAMGLMR